MLRVVVLSALASLVLSGLPGSLTAEPQGGPAFQEWQILEVKTGVPIAFDDWMTDLAGREVIYLGEEHRNRFHVEAAIKVLEALEARQRRPVLAMEMFGWDGQAGLDRYLADRETARDRFLQESHWEENWGGAYEDYEPLIGVARERHVPVLALNPPRPLVRRVASLGLRQALADPDMSRWGMRDEPLSDEPAYRELLFKQLRLCHTGLSEDAYQRIYEASVFRDEGMAKTISDRLGPARAGIEPQSGPIVSYTGAGHIQYRVPVPNRVLRRRTEPVRQTTVYLISFEPSRTEEIRQLIRDSVADYLWLTPLSVHGSPRRCP